MATLIWQSAGGRTRRCDARCYNAKGLRCHCLCGGINHGVGEERAREYTAQMAEAILDEYPDAQFAPEWAQEIAR